jgi:hypothetical protein
MPTGKVKSYKQALLYEFEGSYVKYVNEICQRSLTMRKLEKDLETEAL